MKKVNMQQLPREEATRHRFVGDDFAHHYCHNRGSCPFAYVVGRVVLDFLQDIIPLILSTLHLAGLAFYEYLWRRLPRQCRINGSIGITSTYQV